VPEYSYLCECGHSFSIIETMTKHTKKPSQKCPICKKKAKRDYSTDFCSTTTAVRLNDSELNVGHLAHRNTERMSNDEKAHLTYEHNKYRTESPKELPKGMKRGKDVLKEREKSE